MNCCRYSTLTERTISVSGSTFSSLEWTSIAWGAGLVLAAPILAFISLYINGPFQTLITAAATGIGFLFCLPVGLFKTTKIFILYIAMIVVAITVSTATHTHHLALMAPTLSRPPLKRLTLVSSKQGISSWISLCATVVGCLGACIVSSFTYHMLREPIEREYISLWIVSIFCGLLWLVGVLHAVTAENRTSSVPNILSSRLQLFTIFKNPNAIGGLVSVLLSSFTTMSIFTGGVLFILGQLCIEPVHVLYFWLTYFLFPLVSLPLLFQPLQHLIKANSVKMKIMGLLLSLISSGFGFYFWDSHWKWGHLLVFGAIQGTSSGLLHTFGRVLMLDTAPRGEEGGFSVWYGWVKGVGLCGGFIVGSVVPGRVRTSFGAAFCSALIGIVVLLFGNVNDFGVVREGGEMALDSKESISV